MNRDAGRLKIDLLTLAAIAALAWILVNVSHEIVGHAGAAVVLGIPVRAVSTTTASIEGDQVTTIGAYRTINAAGTLANFIGAAAALFLLSLWRQASSPTRYFLWLFATFSFIIISMNLISMSLLGGGDWTDFARELEPAGLWKAMIIAVGVIIAVVGYILPLRLWMPDLHYQRRTLLAITGIPVLTLIVVQSLSLVGSPFARLPSADNHLLASVFAYLHFILWAVLVNVIPGPRSKLPPQSISLLRSYGWLTFGLVSVLLYCVVLGPGLGPLEDDPRLG